MPGNSSTQLDRGRELATLLEDGEDRSGLRIGDDEHARSMGRRDVGSNCQARS
jgi:hypothetical protein